MAKVIPGSAFTESDTSPTNVVGQVQWYRGKAYRYMQVEDQAVTIGQVVEFSDTTGKEVTTDRSGGSSIGRIAAGVALGSVADASYGWFQVYGTNDYVVTDGGVSAGEGLVPHATADGQADSVVASTTGYQVFGFALNADTATTIKNCKAFLKML